MGTEVEVSREQFWREVWSDPPYRVAMKYGLAETGISKVCNENGIPKPAPNYWKKLAAGVKVYKRDLPNVKDPQPVRFRSRHERIGEEDPELLDLACSKIEFELDPANKITVPEELVSPHAVTVRVKKELKQAMKIYIGSRSTTGYPRVEVSDDVQPRALMLLDALAKALEQRGYDPADLHIFGQKLKICITEDYDSELKPGVKEAIKADPFRSGYRLDDHERTLSGRLILSLEFKGYCGDGLRRNWKDRKTTKVEDLLNEIIVGMIRHAAVIREWELERERWHREYEEDERLREEEERRQVIIQARREKLMSHVDRWHQAVLIREFVMAVKLERVAIDPELSMCEWISWAYAEADRIDPLV